MTENHLDPGVTLWTASCGVLTGYAGCSTHWFRPLKSTVGLISPLGFNLGQKGWHQLHEWQCPSLDWSDNLLLHHVEDFLLTFRTHRRTNLPRWSLWGLLPPSAEFSSEYNPSILTAPQRKIHPYIPAEGCSQPVWFHPLLGPLCFFAQFLSH